MWQKLLAEYPMHALVLIGWEWVQYIRPHWPASQGFDYYCGCERCCQHRPWELTIRSLSPQQHWQTQDSDYTVTEGGARFGCVSMCSHQCCFLCSVFYCGCTLKLPVGSYLPCLRHFSCHFLVPLNKEGTRAAFLVWCYQGGRPSPSQSPSPFS